MGCGQLLRDGFPAGFEPVLESRRGKTAGLKNHLLEHLVIAPIKRQGRIQSTDGLPGAENPVESGPAQKRVPYRQLNPFACLELLQHGFAAVTKPQFPENQPRVKFLLWRLFARKRMPFDKPCAVIRMQPVKRYGHHLAVGSADGHALHVTLHEFPTHAAFAISAFPITIFGMKNAGKREQ